ncbi:substrate-binding domain-containing protein [Rubritalea tangerina]|uniref:Substrate-binding domain-containing protein n=1 Tax=Rubritalea tangerina TaxID=430798 RepID=A0ABW4ZD06_9BACT
MQATLKRIGLRIPNWFMMQDAILLGIVEYIREHDKLWQLEVPRGSDGELPEVKIDACWDGDGLISFRYTAEEVAAFRQRGVAHVNLSSVSHAGLATVLPNNVAAGELAAQHLLNIGLVNFVYIGRSERNYSRERFSGFQRVLAREGAQVEAFDLDVNALAVGERAGYMANKLRRLLPRLATPCGVFAADDLLAANILRVAADLGINVPGQLAVIGTNSQPIFCLSTRPSLTSVQYPGREIGYKAAEKLDNLLSGKEEEVESVVPVRLVDARESTNTLAYSDERLKKALKFIQVHAPSEALQVNEVCTHLAISKSSLKELMSRELGRSPKAEISRVRLEVFKRYLEETDMSVKEISYAMGFPAAEEASRFFRRMCEMTPTHYRELC